ncbi:MAG: hypothetical protein ACP5O0_09875 [Acidimicrobiales bacterium]
MIRRTIALGGELSCGSRIRQSLRHVMRLLLGGASVLLLASCVRTGHPTSTPPGQERVPSSVIAQALKRTLAQQSFHVVSTEKARIGGSTISALSVDGVEAHASSNPSAAFSLTLPAPVGKVQALVLNHHEYLSLPRSLIGEVPSSVSWFVLDPGAIADATLGSGASVLFSAFESNPSALLDDLYGLVGSTVSVIGRGVEVNGVKTVEYSAAVSLLRALRRSGARTSEAGLRRVAQTLGSGPAACQVWIDDAGRIRELRLEVNAARLSHQRARIVEFLQLGDFGTPVHVVRPSSSTVEQLPGLSGIGSG